MPFSILQVGVTAFVVTLIVIQYPSSLEILVVFVPSTFEPINTSSILIWIKSEVVKELSALNLNFNTWTVPFLPVELVTSRPVTKLKALKHREGWEKLIYNNPTFVDRKSGESLTVDDSDYIFGIFYFKPKDSSFLVAKRNGKGININWGNIIGKSIGIAIIVAIIACVSSVAYISISLNNTTTLNLVLENENVVINGTYGELLPYKEMTTVEYLDKIPKVEMNLDGVKSGNSYFGIYYIEGVGRAKLYVEDINEPVVKILTNGYLPVYINYQKLSSTQWLYNSVGSRRNNIYKT